MPEPSDLRVRAAGPADLDALSPLLVAQLGEHRAPADDDAIHRALAELLATPSLGFVLVAERDGAIVGVAQLSFGYALEHGGRTAWLDELFVAPPFREAGIGTRLLRVALDEARRAGAHAVDLEVDAEHARAARLYLRDGFVPLSRSRFYRGL